jgi:hypothetical protein
MTIAVLLIGGVLLLLLGRKKTHNSETDGSQKLSDFRDVLMKVCGVFMVVVGVVIVVTNFLRR